MTDLAEFLLARIAEDEFHARQIAKLVAEDQAWMDNPPSGQPSARVLADCAAKRAIAKEHHQAGDTSWSPYKGLCAVCGEFQDWPCTTLKLLALPYADHPDYRKEEWRP